MTLICVSFDDDYLRQVCKRIVQGGVTISACFTVAPERMAEHATAQMIDARLLYRARDVRLAMPGVRPSTISRADLQELLECERFFMIATDRTNHAPSSVKERKRLFRELVRYVDGFLAARADSLTVLFESTPHMGWDIILFYVARMRGLQTLIVTRTLLPDYIMLLDDFRTVPPLASTPVELDPSMEKAICAPSAWSAASDQRNRDALAGKGRMTLKQRMVEPLRLWKLAGRPPRFVSATAGEAPSSPLSVEFLRRHHAKWSTALRSAHDTRVQQPPDSPYVYFALHYQPERTTQPEGLEFEDQLLALEILSGALPDGWRIVVKEHPRQFELTPLPLRLRHARTPYDYEEFAAIKGVTIVPLDYPGQRLLEQCRMAATITGSTGWEALRLCKPALVFGACWYSACKSVALVSSVVEARAAFARLVPKQSADVKLDVRDFLRHLAPLLVRSTTAEAYARQSNISYEELAEGLARAVARRLKTPIMQKVAK